MRNTLVLSLLLTASLSAQSPLAGPKGPVLQASAPADAWRQFRGSHTLTGVTASPAPAALKVLWTFNAGEVVDSSAAIADGVVYIGGGGGDLFAPDLATGK